MEIRQIVEAHRQGHIQNRGITLFKQLYRLFQAQIIDVLDTGHVHVLLEKTHKMIFTEITNPGQLRYGNRLGIVKLDVIKHQLQLVLRRSVV